MQHHPRHPDQRRREWITNRRAAVGAAYDAQAATYDRHPYPNRPQQAWINRLLALCPHHGTVLDAPCGTGRYFAVVAAAGHRVVGIDQSAKMLAQARRRGVAIDLQRLGLQEIGFVERFDAVMTIDAMENIAPEDWPVVLTNLHRALRRAGHLYLTVEEQVDIDFTAVHNTLLARGLPVVLGEVVDGDVAGYHYYPTREQVLEWSAAAGLTVIDEASSREDGWGYRHLLLQRPMHAVNRYATKPEPEQGSDDMNDRPDLSLSTSRRTTRPVAGAAAAIIATITIGVCSHDATEATMTSTTSVEVATTLGSETHTGFFAGADDVSVTFTLPAGWHNNGWGVIKGNPIYGLIFMNVDNIYTDSCPSVQLDPPVGPAVDDLATAWQDLPGFDATEPIDVTLDGHHGKQIEFTVPDYNEDDCHYGMFRLLREAGGGGDYWAQGPNQHTRLWILDVEGTRLVIGASYFPDTSSQDRAELDLILNSIRIGPQTADTEDAPDGAV